MAMRQPGTETDPLMYEHITLADLNIFVDYFTSYDHESAQDLEIRGFNFGSEAKRVRINCEGDQRFGVENMPQWPSREIIWYNASGKHGTCRDLQTYWLSTSGAELSFRSKVGGLCVWV